MQDSGRKGTREDDGDVRSATEMSNGNARSSEDELSKSFGV
jgi:hypothetical protein